MFCKLQEFDDDGYLEFYKFLTREGEEAIELLVPPGLGGLPKAGREVSFGRFYLPEGYIVFVLPKRITLYKVYAECSSWDGEKVEVKKLSSIDSNWNLIEYE